MTSVYDATPAAAQTPATLDATADRLVETLDTLGALLADFTVALHQFNANIAGFNGTVTDFDTVVGRADGLLGRAEGLLAPLAATQQVGDQIKAASQVAGLVASAAVKRGVAAGKGLTQRAATPS
ncbi:hypothetical protein ASE01_23315 [Nocardioides sp. Root190]|uniref:hypothetical protein n=1 Tax=Nocardioides sp. Root190 TaxID=1736488 RepID=UPI0006F1C967|nr:hypothetical protein [Nocardioides sp. Root190]KRB79243.1 hypothetical protein ASE01_23315 [Nocardioides sp. Root190]